MICLAEAKHDSNEELCLLKYLVNKTHLKKGLLKI